MRPPGEIRLAILQAATDLVVIEQDGSRRGPTLKELAQRACVGVTAARQTVQNLTRARALVRVAQREVDYRNKPVWEYAPAHNENEETAAQDAIARTMALWVRR